MPIIFCRQATDDDDCDARYERIHSREVAVSGHQARSAPSIASCAPVGKLPSTTCRGYPTCTGNTARKTYCNRTSSENRTTNNIPDVLHQCIDRSHQFSSRITHDTANTCRHVQLDRSASRCIKSQDNRTGISHLSDIIVARPKRLPDDDISGGKFRSSRRKLQTSHADEHLLKQPLSKITTNVSERCVSALRRQGRFVGRRFQHAEHHVRMTFRKISNDDSSSDIGELHPAWRRWDQTRHRRREALDRTVSTTSTVDGAASCLDRGFLITGDTSDDDSRVSGLRSDHRRFRRQQCVWDPDISPIGRRHSVAIDIASKYELEFVEPDRSSHLIKSTESMEKIDRQAGLFRCEDAVTGNSADNTDTRWIDEKNAPNGRPSGNVPTKHKLCSAKTVNKHFQYYILYKNHKVQMNWSDLIEL